jgi:hypothetical protein
VFLPELFGDRGLAFLTQIHDPTVASFYSL